jgi:protein ImuA
MLSSRAVSARRRLVEELQGQLDRLERDRSEEERAAGSGEPLAWSAGLLDRLLPEGLRRGVLVEWLAPCAGGGAGSLALSMAHAACCQGRALVVVDEAGDFHAPAAAAAGIDLERTIVVRPGCAEDAAWALDQSLRCAGVGAVLSWPQRLPGRTGRRLQLAAATGGTLGLLVRPAAARTEPCWGVQRWLVEPRPSLPGAQAVRRVRVSLLYCRGGPSTRGVDLELVDGTGAMRLVAELADPAVDGGAAAAPRARHRAL